MSEGTNLGAGNEESDSATDETPQNETGAGDAKRKKGEKPCIRLTALKVLCHTPYGLPDLLAQRE